MCVAGLEVTAFVGAIDDIGDQLERRRPLGAFGLRRRFAEPRLLVGRKHRERDPLAVGRPGEVARRIGEIGDLRRLAALQPAHEQLRPAAFRRRNVRDAIRGRRPARLRVRAGGRDERALLAAFRVDQPDRLPAAICHDVERHAHIGDLAAVGTDLRIVRQLQGEQIAALEQAVRRIGRRGPADDRPMRTTTDNSVRAMSWRMTAALFATERVRKANGVRAARPVDRTLRCAVIRGGRRRRTVPCPAFRPCASAARGRRGRVLRPAGAGQGRRFAGRESAGRRDGHPARRDRCPRARPAVRPRGEAGALVARVRAAARDHAHRIPIGTDARSRTCGTATHTSTRRWSSEVRRGSTPSSRAARRSTTSNRKLATRNAGCGRCR